MVHIFQADNPERVEAVRQLFLEYAESIGFDLCFQSFQQELAQLPGKYAPPSGRLLLAEVEGQVAGCVALHKLEDGICEMKRLYVRPAFHAQHLGRMLAGAIIDAARELSYARMRLDTIASKMQAAVQLYRSLGFREIEPYTVNPIPTAMYMALDLRSEAAQREIAS